MKTLSMILACLALLGCSRPEYLSPEELTKYIANPENGLTQHQELSGYAIDVTYRPTDMLVQQEVGDHPDAKTLSVAREKYSKYFYFILSLSQENKEALNTAGGFDQYSELVQTMSFRMTEFTSLTTSSQDTIPTADFIMDRTYGMSNATNLLFVFDKSKAKGKDWVQFNLNEFGMGVGNQRFRFKTEDLEEAPKLKFE